MKLVILGNGFDLHHELNTSFSQFRDYLINKNAKEMDKIINKIKGELSRKKEDS